MVSPIDYSQAVQQPFQALAQGYQLGAGIRSDQQQQQALLASQQQQAQQRQVIQSLLTNPSAGAADYSNAMLVVPGLKDQLTAAWKTKSDAQQQAALADGGQWLAAIQQGQPQAASGAIRARADMLDSQSGSPTPQSQALRTQADLIDAHPDFAAFQMKLMLAAHGEEGQKMVDRLATLKQQPDLDAKVHAEAVSAQADAAVKTATVPALAAKPGIDNQKTEQDIAASQLAGRISELNTGIAQANSETERGKLTLERDKLVQQQTQTKQTQQFGAQDAQDKLSAALETVSEIRKALPTLTDHVDAPGSLMGSLLKKMTGTDRRAFDDRVDNLKAQLTLGTLQQMKASSPTGASGLGSTSDSELKTLAADIANLDTDNKDFPEQYLKVERRLNKLQSTNVSRGNLPGRGQGAVVMTIPGQGNVREGDINDIMSRYSLSRDQALQKLQQLANGGIVPAIPTR